MDQAKQRRLALTTPTKESIIYATALVDHILENVAHEIKVKKLMEIL